MTIADYEAVVSLWTITAGVKLSSADSRDAIERYLARNQNLSFVARIQDGIVGTILSGHDGRRGYLHHLAVAQSHRRRSIGTSLVRMCVEALAQKGITKTHLFVLNDNHAGCDFWQRMGWQCRDDIKIFSYTTPEDRCA